MASTRSIRKRSQDLIGLTLAHRYLIERFGPRMSKSLAKAIEDGLAQLRELVAMFQPAHVFQVGEYATRDGSDVQQVVYAVDRFADFKCILAPLTGWCEVGEVEHNAMRRYRHLTKDEAVAMVLARIHGAECKADGTMSAPIHGEGR